jgi:2,4-dienoyl-CoA reductase-like NADH-dependent reductase (Old Yellow Enzyme family)
MMTSLLDPITINGVTLQNRLVLPPMQTSLATTNGAVTDELIDYYTQRSEAPGLVIVEHSYVSLEGKLSEKQLGIYDDTLIAGLEQLVTTVHATGTPIVIQLNHAGRTTREDMTGYQPIAPSATERARQLAVTELRDLADMYTLAADRAMNAGFDGVEVHGAHGFLLNQFYSPLANTRTDQYGGSLENRMRFPLDVVSSIRNTIGTRLLLYRIGAVDLNPAGTQLEDSKRFAIQLEKAGVDLIDVSGGLCGSRPAHLQQTPGYFIPQAHSLKSVVTIPVIGVGGIRDPHHANRLIQEKAVDLIAVGRPILNDTGWADTFLKEVPIGSSS